MKKLIAGLILCASSVYADVRHYGATAVSGSTYDLTAATSVKPFKTGTGAPTSTDCDASGEVGRTYFRTDGASGQNLYVCENNGGSYQWAQTGGSSGASITVANNGMFWPFGVPQLSAGASPAYVSKQTRFWQFQNPYTVSVSSSRIYQQGAGTVSSYTVVGIYDENCTLISSGSVANNSGAGGLSISMTPTTLSPGIYYWGMSTEDGAVTYLSSSLGSAGAALWQASETGNNLRSFSGTASTGTGSGLTLPSTCGTRTALTTATVIFPFVNILPR